MPGGRKSPRSLEPDDPRHGTYNAYDYWQCRCDLCTKAHAAYRREWYVRTGRGRPRAARAPKPLIHGHANTYKRGCHCPDCTGANAAATAAYRARPFAEKHHNEGRDSLGVIVTLVRRDGAEVQTVHRSGLTQDALRAALEPFDPATWQVTAVSTPRTILADLRGSRSGSPTGSPESLLLSKIGAKAFL